MKRPTKPKLKTINELILREYDWSHLIVGELVDKLSSLNIPLYELYFSKEYDYNGDSQMNIYRRSTPEKDLIEYENKIEQYKKDLIAYHEYKAKQIKEDLSCEETEILNQ